MEELLEVITWAQLGIHDKPVKNTTSPSRFLDILFLQTVGMDGGTPSCYVYPLKSTKTTCTINQSHTQMFV